MPDICPCSDLDWRDVDQTAEHHPDCAFQRATLAAAARDAIPESVEIVPSKPSGTWTAPRVYGCKVDSISAADLNRQLLVAHDHVSISQRLAPIKDVTITLEGVLPDVVDTAPPSGRWPELRVYRLTDSGTLEEIHSEGQRFTFTESGTYLVSVGSLEQVEADAQRQEAAPRAFEGEFDGISATDVKNFFQRVKEIMQSFSVEEINQVSREEIRLMFEAVLKQVTGQAESPKR